MNLVKLAALREEMDRDRANVSVTEHGRTQATVEQLQARVEELEHASAKAKVGVGLCPRADFSSPISASDLRLHRPAE